MLFCFGTTLWRFASKCWDTNIWMSPTPATLDALPWEKQVCGKRPFTVQHKPWISSTNTWPARSASGRNHAQFGQCPSSGGRFARSSSVVRAMQEHLSFADQPNQATSVGTQSQVAATTRQSLRGHGKCPLASGKIGGGHASPCRGAHHLQATIECGGRRSLCPRDLSRFTTTGTHPGTTKATTTPGRNRGAQLFFVSDLQQDNATSGMTTHTHTHAYNEHICAHMCTHMHTDMMLGPAQRKWLATTASE
jgi:hypothetical protein